MMYIVGICPYRGLDISLGLQEMRCLGMWKVSWRL